MIKKKTIFDKKEECLSVIAYATLLQWKGNISKENVEKEKFRLDRVISDIYCKTNIDMDYNEFVLEFIKENMKNIVYGTEYAYDVSIPDKFTELNVNNVIEKYNRKQCGMMYS